MGYSCKCEPRYQLPPPPKIYEDDEIEVVPAMTDDELEKVIEYLMEHGHSDPWEIRRLIGYRAGIDRIQHVKHRIELKKKTRRRHA